VGCHLEGGSTKCGCKAGGLIITSGKERMPDNISSRKKKKKKKKRLWGGGKYIGHVKRER